MICAIYARVSREEQHTDNQLPELRAYAEREGWQVVEYVEHASGKEGGKRPVLSRLLSDALLKKFGAVVVWKIDRFGRSIKDFIANVQSLDAAGIRFICPFQGIDTDQRSPFSKMLMHILAIFAEFERDLIVDRVNAGLREYRRQYAAGKVGRGLVRESRSKLNRPCGRPKKIFDRHVVTEMRGQGMSWRAIEKALGVKQSTIRLRLQETQK